MLTVESIQRGGKYNPYCWIFNDDNKTCLPVKMTLKATKRRNGGWSLVRQLIGLYTGATDLSLLLVFKMFEN